MMKILTTVTLWTVTVVQDVIKLTQTKLEERMLMLAKYFFASHVIHTGECDDDDCHFCPFIKDILSDNDLTVDDVSSLMRAWRKEGRKSDLIK